MKTTATLKLHFEAFRIVDILHFHGIDIFILAHRLQHFRSELFNLVLRKFIGKTNGVGVTAMLDLHLHLAAGFFRIGKIEIDLIGIRLRCSID